MLVFINFMNTNSNTLKKIKHVTNTYYRYENVSMGRTALPGKAAI